MMKGTHEDDPTGAAGILIVDDDQRNRFAARAVLEPLGHYIDEADSAAAAFEALSARDFAVILLDLMMPGTDGFEFLRILRERGLATKTAVVVVSALDSHGSHSGRVRALGVADYFSKPFPPDELRARVAALLDDAKRAQSAGPSRDQRSHDAEQARAVADQLHAVPVPDEAARNKDKLLGILGHDLRNPLSAMLTGAALLAKSLHLSEADQRTLARMTRSANRMASLVRDILDFTRAGTGLLMPIACAPANLGDICDAVVDELGLAHEGQTFSVVKRGALEGHWDRDRIEQALSNVVGNAIEHGRGEVRVTASSDRDQVSVCVWNGGPLISRDMLARLFEPYKPGAKGLGLGLYIAREIVQAHGGRIDASSMSEAGTSVTVHLPRYATAPS